VQFRNLVAWSLCAAVIVTACTRVETVDKPTVTLGGAGGDGSDSGGSDADGGMAGDRSAGGNGGEGGAPLEPALGLWPTYAADPLQSRDVQAVRAAVSGLSLGARALPLYERWDELAGATGSPRTVAWTRLDAMAAPFADRGSVALCIGIVDRREPAWPFDGELDNPDATSAIERTIDEVYARLGPSLSHLCFGYEIDRFLAAASDADRASLLGVLSHAVDYARRHAARSSKTAVGVAVGLGALSNADDASALADLLLGDEVTAVYDPLDEAGRVKPPGSVADEVAAALEELAKLPGRRRTLSLFEVGYPSAKSVGSSEAEQQAFYRALFGALDARLGQVSFVGINGLADRAAADCEAEAPSFVDATKADLLGAWAEARCAMGLRAESDKPAWIEVSAALSRYR
jgi:hypothetical protein